MDTMEVNKAVAAVLVAGIAFFVTGTIGTILVHDRVPKETAIKIEGVQAPASGGPAQPEKIPPIAPFMAAADPAAGEAFAKKVCAACHTFNQGGRAGVGPNLYGVLGAPHGHMEGFNYSAAIKSKQGPWSYEELNEWLAKPAAYAPGTRMAFAGINSEKERANVIAYLRSLSPNPQPLPSPQPASTPGPGAGNQTGGSQGTQTSASGAPAGESPTAGQAQSTQPPAPQGAAGAGSPTPDAGSR